MGQGEWKDEDLETVNKAVMKVCFSFAVVL